MFPWEKNANHFETDTINMYIVNIKKIKNKIFN